MNLPALKLIAVFVAVLATLPAHAQRGRGNAPRHPPMRTEPAPLAEQMRRGMPHDAASRAAPMTAEERRQLRRDIDEAGRELYRPHGRRGMPPTRD